MKHYYLFFLFVCMFISRMSYSQTLKNSDLKGQVKTVTEITFRASNKTGNIQKGIVSGKKVFTYNKDGILESETFCELNEKMQLYLNRMYKYYSTNSVLSYDAYINSKNNVLSKTNSKSKNEYKIDEKGNIIERREVAQGKIGFRETFIFNRNNKLVEQNQYSSNGSIMLRMSYNYHEDGSFADHKTVTYLSNGIAGDSSVRKFKYNEKDELTQTILFGTIGTVTERTFYSYSEDGNLLAEIIRDSEMELIDYTKYEKYDATGNWLKKIITTSGEVSAIMERSIEYYNEPSNNLFTGTKKFCDENGLWYYLVTINQNNIVIKTFAGKNNTYYKYKTTPTEIIKGVIKNGVIITKDTPEYPVNRFGFDNGTLLRINNEGGVNPYTECK